MKNQKNKKTEEKIEFCEGCGCTPCDCDWGTMELPKDHTNHNSKKANDTKTS